METGRANSWFRELESKLVKDYVNDVQWHMEFWCAFEDGKEQNPSTFGSLAMVSSVTAVWI